MEHNGQCVNWDPIQKVWEASRSALISTVPGLTKQVVEPDAHDKMRVKFAVTVFSPQMQVAIRAHKVQNAEGTLLYLKQCWELWGAMRHYQHRNASPGPLRGEDMPQYKEQLQSILAWFADWGQQCSGKGQAKRCIPTTTLQDIHLWVNGFLGFAEEFFKESRHHAGQHAPVCLWPSRFSQDSLENFFGQIRAQCGCSTNPQVLQALTAASATVHQMMRGQTAKISKGSYQY